MITYKKSLFILLMVTNAPVYGMRALLRSFRTATDMAASLSRPLKTVLIIKPEAIQEKDKIIKKLTDHNFIIYRMRELHLTEEQAKQLYKEHIQRVFFQELLQYITSGPLAVIELEHAHNPHSTIIHLRKLIGHTNPLFAEQGTLRAQFGTDKQCNAVHSSDSVDAALREHRLFFPSDPA